MEQMATWETVVLGALVILIIFWFRPGIKETLRRSQEAEKDWPAVLVPILLVVLFVVFLVMIT